MLVFCFRYNRLDCLCLNTGIMPNPHLAVKAFFRGLFLRYLFDFWSNSHLLSCTKVYFTYAPLMLLRELIAVVLSQCLQPVRRSQKKFWHRGTVTPLMACRRFSQLTILLTSCLWMSHQCHVLLCCLQTSHPVHPWRDNYSWYSICHLETILIKY